MILEIDQNFPQPGIVEHAVEIIKQNHGIIAYPTDTVYGLGCDIFDKIAVEKIYKFKQREQNKTLSFMCRDIKEIEKYAQISKDQKEVLKKHLPGAFTFILNASKNAPEYLQKDGKIAVRIPRNRFCISLINELDSPITTTSLNISGEPVITSISQLSKQQVEVIDVILDAGVLSDSSSTVVDLTVNPYKVVREGKGLLIKN